MAKIPIYKNKSLKNIKGEEWREILYAEGYYLVSNFGRIKALERMVYSDAAPNGRRLKEKIMSQSISKNSNRHTSDQTFELSVTYQFEKVRIVAMVRRLVYEAFIQPKTKQKMDDKYVYPQDGNGLNCRADNLGLASRTELRIRELQNKRYIPPVHLTPPECYIKLSIQAGRSRRRRINKYKPDGTLIASYPSITIAAKRNKVSIGCVGLCVQKKLKILKEYIYRYAEEGYKGELKSWKGTEKKIIQYTIVGKKIATYRSINEAGRRLEIEAGTISRTAKKRSKHAGGFVWRYEGDPYKGEYKDVLHKRKFAQYSPKGKKLNTFKSISEAAKQISGSYERIRLALQGTAKTSNGFVWKWLPGK